MVLDKQHDAIPQHLGKIATHIHEWEGAVAEALELTLSDVEGIKTKHPNNLQLQS